MDRKRKLAFCSRKIFSSISRYKKVVIPLQNILFYTRDGDLITKVSGSGGQSSFSMLTGFHGKIKPINIYTTVDDSRKTQLFYKVDSSYYSLSLAHKDYFLLKIILPEKDMSEGSNTTSDQAEASMQKAVGKDSDPQVRLEKLQSLFENKVITEEEYQQKRQAIIAEL